MHAHFDCFSGISGDMTLGALLDLGLEVDWLSRELKGLPVDGFALKTETVFRNGIRALHVTVAADEEKTHRHYRQIRELIQAARIPPAAKTMALAIFARVAEAESTIHGCDLDHVHFHEVGGIDAMVDIVGATLCLDRLGVTSVSATPLPMGSGFVTCRHGVLPVPAPATAAILKGIPVYGADTGQEMVTPTGAAIIAETAGHFGSMPAMTVERIGYGAGSREFNDRPNLLRVLLGTVEKEDTAFSTDMVCVVEATIDDMNPEIFGYLMEKLFDDGALDVWWVPVQMKKHRPGTLIQVLCSPDLRPAVVRRLFLETTTIGVRHREMQRTVLTRDIVSVQTPLGWVAAKRVTGADGWAQLVPEYEACRRLAEETGRPLREIYANLSAAFHGDVKVDG